MAKASSDDELQLNVLVVDDQTVDRKVLRRTVDSCGFQVAMAASGDEALDLLGEASDSKGQDDFDLVLSDVTMPGMDGFELCRRALDEFRGLKVVLVSGDTGADMQDAAEDAGAVGFLSKPVSAAELRQLVGRLYRRRK